MAAEKQPQIVQLRRKKGLGNIVHSKNGDVLNIRLYSQEIKDRDKEGELIGDYKGTTFPGAKEGMSPSWIKAQNKWAWGGTVAELGELIGKMRLRYPKGHDKEGQHIKPGTEEELRDRLGYMQDEVFTHPDLYGKYFMIDGKFNFNTASPIEKFLMLCKKGDRNYVQDRGGDKSENKYIAAGAKYELVSPKAQQKKRKEEVQEEVRAITLLAALQGDEKRIRAVATVLNLPGYSEDTDVDGIFIMLKDTVVSNLDTARKYGGKTNQRRFIEVAEMTNEELDRNSNVVQAIKLGIVRKRDGYILVNGAKVDKIYDELGILNYFANPSNQEAYIDLLDALDNKKL